eukprot:4862012-Ditylum_brightwellii.AAC.2
MPYTITPQQPDVPQPTPHTVIDNADDALPQHMLAPEGGEYDTLPQHMPAPEGEENTNNATPPLVHHDEGQDPKDKQHNINSTSP